jgi:hypothetical protein
MVRLVTCKANCSARFFGSGFRARPRLRMRRKPLSHRAQAIICVLGAGTAWVPLLPRLHRTAIAEGRRQRDRLGHHPGINFEPEPLSHFADGVRVHCSILKQPRVLAAGLSCG